ncbi:MAG: Inner-membrane translocator [Thermotogota bacterium]|nr:Inner-membrane translocator [Thermotogota bacterium]
MIAIFEQGLIMGIMALGVFLSFRILNMPDLTVDGSFALGGAVSVSLLITGTPALTALLSGAIFGGLAGMITALIHRKLKVNPLLAGILVMTMIYSVNLRIMNGPNLPIPSINITNTMKSYEEITGEDPLAGLFGDAESTNESKSDIMVSRNANTSNNIFSTDGTFGNLIILLLFALIVVILMGIFLRTDLGMVMRGFGSNPDGVQAFGVPKTFIAVLGFVIANALVGLSGGLFALYSGFSDVTMGQGMIVTGLAMVMLGEILFGRRKILFGLLAPIIGAIIYQAILALVMRYGYRIGFRSSDMKLLTALFIVGMIGISLLSKKRKSTFKLEVRKLWSNSKTSV